jgi:hypothetical protein
MNHPNPQQLADRLRQADPQTIGLPEMTNSHPEMTNSQFDNHTSAERLLYRRAEMIAEMEALGIPIPPGTPRIEDLLIARFQYETR